MEVSFTKEYIEEQVRLALAQFGYDCSVEIESQDILCVMVFARQGVELDGRCKQFRFCATHELTRSSMSGRHRKNYYEWHEALQKFASAAFWLTRTGNIRGASDEATKRFMDGYNAAHKEENAENARRFHEAHRDEELARKKKYNDSHREEILARKKDYYDSHRAEILAQKKAYCDSHREEIKIRCKAYNDSHCEEIAARNKDYYDSHREEILDKKKSYHESHRAEILAKKKSEREQLWTNGTEILKWSTLNNRGRKADLLAQGWHPIQA